MEQRKAWYPNGFQLRPLPEFPPGVGVPGKPITPDQFYTEDVFRMLVPDDGLTPVKESGWQPDRLQRPERNADPSMALDPGYGNDQTMERLPPTDVPANTFCDDWKRVKNAFTQYRSLEQALGEARAQLTSATSEAERVQLQDLVKRYEAGLAEWRPDYESSLKCTTSA